MAGVTECVNYAKKRKEEMKRATPSDVVLNRMIMENVHIST